MKAKGILFVLLLVTNGLLACDSLDVTKCFGPQIVFRNGGEEGMMKFIGANFHYPHQEKHISGKVFVSFIVDTLGNTKNVEIVKSLDENIDEEVIRVIKLLVFEPAKQGEKLVEVKMTLPLIFKHDDEDEK